MLRPNILAIYLTIVLLAGLGFCGCGGGGTTAATPGTGNGSGMYSGNVTVSVDWPQAEGDQLKEIPSDTHSFVINIYEAGGSVPVVPPTTLLYPQYQVTIENVSLGSKTIYILGYNQANQVVAYGYQDVTVVAGDNPAACVAMTPGSPTTSPTGNVPTVLASGLQSPVACGNLGNNLEQVFFAQAGAGNGTISVNTRSVTTLASGLYFAPNNSPIPPNQVVFNPIMQFVAWTEYGGGISPGHGRVRGVWYSSPPYSSWNFSTNAPTPTAINVGDQYVAWAQWGTAPGQGQLIEAPIGGGTPTVLCSGLNQPLYMNNANGAWYWTQYDGTVQRLPSGGSSFQTVMSGLTSPGYVQTDYASGNGVFVVDSSSGGRIWKIPESGTPYPITTPENTPCQVHVGSYGYLYYSVYAGGTAGAGSIKQVPIGGGSSTVLASGLSGPGPLGTNQSGTILGWSEYTGGSIKMLNLPTPPQP